MTTAFVTGANKGIGLDTVRQLLDLDWTVWLGARDPGRGQAAVDAIAAEHRRGDLRLLTIDVADDDSVIRAAETLTATGLDVLVNNAGIAGDVPPVTEATADQLREVLEVNTLGALRTTRALLPLLRESSTPRIVNVSSGLGTFATMTDPSAHGSEYPDLGYPVSKAALNMLTVQYAKAVPEVRFVLVEPGFTATDLNGHAGPQSPEKAAANVVAAATADLASGSLVGPEGPLDW